MELNEEQREILQQHLNEGLNKILEIKGLNKGHILEEVSINLSVEQDYFEILNNIEEHLNLIEKIYKEQEQEEL